MPLVGCVLPPVTVAVNVGRPPRVVGLALDVVAVEVAVAVPTVTVTEGGVPDAL